LHSIQDLQALGGHLAALLGRSQSNSTFLTFAQIIDPGALQRADVDEGTLPPSFGEMKPKPFWALNH